MNTTQTLTTSNATATDSSDLGSWTRRRWHYALGEETYALLVHGRAATGGGRTGRTLFWTASAWSYEGSTESDDLGPLPAWEEFSPEFRTQARALEWLNVRLAARC